MVLVRVKTMLLFVIGVLKGTYIPDWDRIAREWEREELEEDERERKEEMANRPGIQFDPNDIGEMFDNLQ